MAKTDTPKDDMDTIRAVMLTKQFGQYMQMSSLLEAEKEMYDDAIKTFAEDIRKAATLAGQRVQPKTGKVILNKGWLGGRETIAAKIDSIMSATPEQFICYAAFRLKDAEDNERAAKEKADDAMRQLRRLNRLIEDQDDIAKVRAVVKEWEDYE